MVATPIGNLADITLRALATLRDCDHLFAEDTRHSRKLLTHHGITRQVESLHQHSDPARLDRVIARLVAGESAAYVTDAGTPGISDPGAELVRRARLEGCPVVPIPGPCAAVAALSVAGVSTGWFFMGFLPTQAVARRESLAGVRDLPGALVIYEAPHRVRGTLADLAASLGSGRRVTICRELTKLHEEIAEVSLGDAPAWLDALPGRARGEFVLVVEAPAPREREAPEAEELARVVDALRGELPAAQAARLAARITGAPRTAAYAAAIARETNPTGTSGPKRRRRGR